MDQYDAWHQVQGGFRGDWTLSRSRSLTLQSDVYSARLGQRVTVPQITPPFSAVSSRESPLSGGNVRARWTAPVGAGEYQFQTYFDRTSRDERPVAEKRNTFDLDFQHQRRLGDRHRLVWGTGYRVTRGRIATVLPTAFTPPRRTDQVLTAFAQDDIVLAPERWRLVVGAKLEHNSDSGIELQPSGRLSWNLDAATAMFAAVTRAVRTPSRVETDYTTTSLTLPFPRSCA